MQLHGTTKVVPLHEPKQPTPMLADTLPAHGDGAHSAVCDDAIFGGDFCVPLAGIFKRALLGFEIDVGQSEALTVALRPLEIVDQAPSVVAADVRSVGDRFCDGC